MVLSRVTSLFWTCLLLTALPVQVASAATYTLTEKDSGRTVT